jgi:DNA-binding MarR family transcriptional regulator
MPAAGEKDVWPPRWDRDPATAGKGRLWEGRTERVDVSRYNRYNPFVGRNIQAEIKQSKPFSSLEEEALVALQRTADRLQWQLSEMLKPHGISPTQYNALRILRGAKEHGRACSEIAERMINRDPDITRLIDRLERRGLVARSREQKDRRVITTRITPAGLELLKSLDRPVEEFNRKMLGHLGQPRLRSLIGLLSAAREPAG